MMKRIVAWLSICAMCVAFTGCGFDLSEEHTSGDDEEPVITEEAVVEEDVTINVATLKGPTSMGLVKMINDAMNRVESENEYAFSVLSTVDEITPLVVQGTVDIAAVPANLASVLYNKTDKNVTVLAINTLGVLYICEKGDTVQSVADLKGKTIYASGKGATPEYALTYILEQNGLDPDTDVTIEWKSEHTECVSAIEADDDGIALLPQPFVTTAQMKDSDIRVALDLTEEWDSIQVGEEVPSSLVTGVAIVRNDFLEAHPTAVANFMEDYQNSIDYVNNNVDDAATMIGELGIVTEEVAKLAIPECNITFIAGTEMKDKLSGYLEMLSEQSTDAIGGTLPDEQFYYQLP